MTNEWAISGEYFLPNKGTTNKLPSNIYDIGFSRDAGGYFFRKIEINIEDLLYDGKCVSEIMKYMNEFWKHEDMFSLYDISFKRGILMYGPPGTGKSCIIRVLMQRMIELDGIVVMIDTDQDTPDMIHKCLRLFSKTEPNRKILVCIEDVESYIKNDLESSFINLIDGTTSINNIVFVATTNYVDKLPTRITRPSRFDKIVEIGLPDEDTRWKYLQFLSKGNGFKIPNNWKKDSDGMTYAEMKEAFISVTVFKTSFKDIKKQFKKDYSGQEVV